MNSLQNQQLVGQFWTTKFSCSRKKMTIFCYRTAPKKKQRSHLLAHAKNVAVLFLFTGVASEIKRTSHCTKFIYRSV
jgi:hypothetical protein